MSCRRPRIPYRSAQSVVLLVCTTVRNKSELCRSHPNFISARWAAESEAKVKYIHVYHRWPCAMLNLLSCSYGKPSARLFPNLHCLRMFTAGYLKFFVSFYVVPTLPPSLRRDQPKSEEYAAQQLDSSLMIQTQVGVQQYSCIMMALTLSTSL